MCDAMRSMKAVCGRVNVGMWAVGRMILAVLA